MDIAFPAPCLHHPDTMMDYIANFVALGKSVSSLFVIPILSPALFLDSAISAALSSYVQWPHRMCDLRAA